METTTVMNPEKVLKMVEDLRRAGFVHVTGLQVESKYLPGGVSLESPYIQANRADLGRWDYVGGLVLLVTLNGQVWLGSVNAKGGMTDKYAPYGRLTNVIMYVIMCGQLPMKVILERVADPFSDCEGNYPPDVRLIN